MIKSENEGEIIPSYEALGECGVTEHSMCSELGTMQMQEGRGNMDSTGPEGMTRTRKTLKNTKNFENSISRKHKSPFSNISEGSEPRQKRYTDGK